MFRLYSRDPNFSGSKRPDAVEMFDYEVEYDRSLFHLMRFHSGEFALLHGRPIVGSSIFELSEFRSLEAAFHRLDVAVGNFTCIGISEEKLQICTSFYSDLDVFYAAKTDGGVVVSSALQDAIAFLGTVTLNLGYCADFMAQNNEFGPATFAKEVLKMELGSKLLRKRGSTEFRTEPFNLPTEKKEDFFAACVETLGAYLGNEKRVVLQFSGGLDSSFLLAALRETGIGFHALHFILADEQRSPEVDVAISAAKELGIHLTIATGRTSYTFQRNDFALQTAVNSPYHVILLSDQMSNRDTFFNDQLAALALPDALFVTGHGGDDVFVQFPNRGIGFDGFKRAGLPGLVRDLAKLSTLKRQVFWRDLLSALGSLGAKDGGMPDHAPDWMLAMERQAGNKHYLLRDKDPRSAKYRHLRGILAGHSEGPIVPDGHFRTIHPMLFQNIVAGVITQPVHTLFSESHDRVLLRENLALHSPISTAWRRTKRSSSDFGFNFLSNNQDKILETISDGPLPELLGLDLGWLTRETRHNANVGMNDHYHFILDALALSAFLKPFSDRITA